MKTENNIRQNQQQNFFDLLRFRFFPHWLLFIILLIVFVGAALFYLRYATPVYEASTTLLIKDEKKGADDTKLMESLNIYASKKLVENEMRVLQSRALMKDAVKTMHLYAPVFEDASFASILKDGKINTAIHNGQFPSLFENRALSAKSAYLSSPVLIEMQDPDQLHEVEQVFFSVDQAKTKVTIGDSAYAVNQWVKTPYGTLRFIPNDKQQTSPKNSLYFSLVEPKKMADRLLNKLNVTATSKLSSIVVLTFKDEVPERGVNVLTQLVNEYNRSGVEDKNALVSNTLAFVENRLKTVKQEVEAEERRIQQYKSQQGVVDISDQGDLYLRNVRENDQQIANINVKLAVLDQVEKYVNSKDAQAGIAPSTVGIDDPGLTKLLENLYDATNDYEKLKKTTAENNPALTSLVSQIQNARPMILDNIRNQRSSLQASRDNLTKTNEKYANTLQELPEKERGLLSISRQQSIQNDIYAFLLQKREETAFSFAATADTRVVDPADSSIRPISPRRSFALFGALALACITGISVVSARELLSRKILFRSEIESYTQLPVVAEISNTNSKQPFAVANPKKAVIAEQFRQLRAAIGLYGKNPEKKTLLVTSGISGEGKSFISSNIALSLSLSGKKVVLVDLDLRNRANTSLFEIDNEKGVSDFITEDAELEEIIHTVPDSNSLFVIGAGTKTYNPTELLLHNRLGELFTFLQDSFDFIIVDSSPIAAVPDAYVLSEYCDVTLLVIRHRYTPKATIELLDQNHKIQALKNTVIVFNGVKSRGFAMDLYGYGYGYGYENVYKQQRKAKSGRSTVA